MTLTKRLSAFLLQNGVADDLTLELAAIQEMAEDPHGLLFEMECS